MQTTDVQFEAAKLSYKSQAVLDGRANSKEKMREGAMKAAKEFEAVFLTSMLENMFTGVEVEEPFGGGHAEKMFRSMQLSEYAKTMSENGGIGVAQHVYQELLAIQEGSVR